MNADADKLGFAAEYVLGTLDATERDQAEALIQSDAAFAALVGDWERKLGELSAMVEPVNPPAELWMAIQGRLAEITPTAPVRLPEFLQVPPAAEDPIAAFSGDVAVGTEAAEAAEADAAVAAAVAVAVAEGKADTAEAAEVPGTEDTTAAAPAADAAVAAETSGIPPAASGEIAAARQADVIDLTQRLRLWRGSAAALGALAAAFAAVIVTAALAPEYLPEPLRPQPEVRTVEVPREVVRTVEVPREVVRTVEVPTPAPGRFVAVLQGSATAPAFIITVDVAQRSLTVRRVAAENQTDHSYELWLISDRFQQPRSLGLIGTNEFTKVPALADYDPDTISNATFAVSLEPEGGSPTGQATGPVLFSGKLVEAVPPAAPPPTP